MAVTWLASTDKSDPSHWGQAYGLYHAAESASGREVILPAATIRAIICVIVMRGCTSQSALSGSPNHSCIHLRCKIVQKVHTNIQLKRFNCVEHAT